MALKTFNVGEILTSDDVNIYLKNSISSIRLTSKQIASSTTLQNDASLVVAVAANSTYELSGQLVYNGVTGGDLKVGWTAPAAASMAWSGLGLTQTAAAFSDDQTFYGTLVDAPIFGALGTGSNQTAVLVLGGLLIVSGTAGNLQLQWAQGTSNVTETTMFAHSYIHVKRIN
jgi:hypothetical protein